MHDQKKIDEKEDVATRQARMEAFDATGKKYHAVFTQCAAHDYSPEALKANAELMLLIPEAYMLYNYRRVALSNYNTTESIAPLAKLLEEELALNSKILVKDYKIYAAFVHRRWIFSELERLARDEVFARQSGSVATPNTALHLLLTSLATETDRCNLLLKLDERNFHAWNYRRWATHEMQKAVQLAAAAGGDAVAETEATTPVTSGGQSALFTAEKRMELQYTTEKIRHNFSNYSAWHQRGLIIQNALERQGSRRQSELPPDTRAALHEQLAVDIDLLTKAVFCDPNDQSAWFYAPFVLDVFEHHCGACVIAQSSNQSVTQTSVDVSNNKGGACRDLVDVFLDTIIDLIAEEIHLEDEDCYLPYHFLFLFLTQLFRKSSSNSTNAAQSSGTYAVDRDRCAQRLRNYARKINQTLYKEHDAEQESIAWCLHELKEQLLLKDPMRRGMYEQLWQETQLDCSV